MRLADLVGLPSLSRSADGPASPLPPHLSARSSDSRSGSDANSPGRRGSCGTQNDQNNPGHPIFSVRSNPTERGLAALRKKLSSIASREPEPDEQPVGVSFLVPPNYKPAFTPRSFPLVANHPRAQWAELVVATPDNGIRMELSDMYAIFTDMERRPTMLTGEDIGLFIAWYTPFLCTLQEFFQLEEQCLYAWIEGTDLMSRQARLWEAQATRVKGPLSEAQRLRRKGDIIRMGNDIENCEALFERRPIAEVLPRLAELVTRFVDELVAYLDFKRDMLPPIINAHLTQRDRSRFEQNYWATARTLTYESVTIVVATRWMDRRQVRRWKAKYFGHHKSLYGTWKTSFVHRHYGFVTEFNDRVLSSEKERAMQMEDNEAARAMMQKAIQNAPCPAEYTDSEAPSGLSSSCASSVRRSNMSSAPTAMPALV